MAAASPSPESPCTNRCGISPETGLCVGCWRTLEEVAAWGGMSDEEKWRVLAELDARRARAEENSHDP